MASPSREQILADFQACSGIEDVGVCIAHLDESKWDLIVALNQVMPRDTQVLPFEGPAIDDVQIIEEIRNGSDVGPNESTSFGNILDLTTRNSNVPMPFASFMTDDVYPSSSQPKTTRLLNLDVHFQGKVFNLRVPDHETVGTVKDLLHKETGLPVCQQVLKGWKGYKHINNDVKLESLNLPRDNVLYLQAPVEDNSVETIDDPPQEEQPTQIYTLVIQDQKNNKPYTINFCGTKTILGIKQDVFNVTNIPVRHQRWTGWPPSASSDSVTLNELGIPPEIQLAVRESEASIQRENDNRVVDIASSDSEEFEDATEHLIDDIFMTETASRKPTSLIPDNVDDDVTGSIHFSESFADRYGVMHPFFFQGSLDDALKEACMKPARDRKLLAVYLHHDDSILSNVFCMHLLCTETVISYLTSNFITWGWDVSHESNMNRLLSAVTKHFGSIVAGNIRTFEVEKFPVLMIIMRSRSNTEVFSFIHGNVVLDELMTSLVHAVDCWTETQRVEVRDDDEREARESVKREQDEAYQISLMADRAKEEAKKAEKEMKERLREEEETNLRKIEEERLHQLKIKEAVRKSLENMIPEEPVNASPDQVIHFRFRVPDGPPFTRKFLTTAKLREFLDFMIVKGYSPEEFKIITNFPKRDLTGLSPNRALRDLDLHSQETLTVEQR